MKKVPWTVGHLVMFCLKQVKLQIIPQLLKWTQTLEPPKVALCMGRSLALLNVLPHLVPTGGALTLIVININTLFIGNVSTSAVTAFQFAAKLLELTIQASLAAILLHVVRWQIVKNRDLPLGSLLAPLHTADVSYLWSLELWAAVTARRWLWRRKLLVLPLILATVILAALVGPSGAILMVPRQINYHYGQYLNIIDPQSALFPATIDYFDPTILDQGMQQVATYFGTGPWPLVMDGGIRTFAAPPDTGLDLDLDPFTPLPHTAIVTPTHMRDILRTRGYNLAHGSSSSLAVLTMETRHPLVHSYCSRNNLLTYRDNDTHITFPDASPEFKNLVTWKDCLEHAESDDKILFFRELSTSNSPRHSTAVIFGTTTPVDRDYLATVDACLIDATWARVTLNGSNTNDYSPLNFVLNEHYNNSIPSSEIIHFPSSWTDRVHTAILNSSVIGTIGLADLQPEKLFALILSNSDPELGEGGFVIEAESRDTCCGHNGVTALGTYLNEINAYDKYLAISLDMYTFEAESYDPSALTYQIITQYQQGYGYDASDITVRLSLAVIGLYCVFVMVHIFMLFLTGYCGTSWDSVTDLLMLGLMSRTPTHLGHVSVGVETLKTFREPVSVGVNDAGAVELVFEDEPDARVGRKGEVEENKAY